MAPRLIPLSERVGARVEALLPQLVGDLSLSTLHDLRQVQTAIHAIVTCLRIEMELTVDFGGNDFTVPVWLGYEQVELSALAVPTINEDGILALELTDPDLAHHLAVIAVASDVFGQQSHDRLAGD